MSKRMHHNLRNEPKQLTCVAVSSRMEMLAWRQASVSSGMALPGLLSSSARCSVEASLL